MTTGCKCGHAYESHNEACSECDCRFFKSTSLDNAKPSPPPKVLYKLPFYHRHEVRFVASCVRLTVGVMQDNAQIITQSLRDIEISGEAIGIQAFNGLLKRVHEFALSTLTVEERNARDAIVEKANRKIILKGDTGWNG